MRRRTFLGTAAAASTLPGAAAAPAKWEWRHYAGDPTSSRYAPLDQITPANVASLKPAWQLETLPANTRAQGMIECTPVCVDGILYLSAHGLYTHAVEAHTGKIIWTNQGMESATARRRTAAAGVSRGVTYWKDGADERIFAPVREHMLAINAKSGKLIDSFGAGGAIDVRKDLGREVGPTQGFGTTTPGVVFEDLLIITSRPDEGPGPSSPGHIRAYDCKTGKLRWIFHTIPQPGQFGYDTWDKDSYKTAGGTNCWGGLSVDQQRGLVFLGTGSPAFDFWGGDRKGMNLFANCVLCLNARTGQRVWHYQTVHHDLFDYDIPCAPNLVTVMFDGKPRDAVAQVAKTGWIYLLDRESGKPLYPIEERPVAKSTVPGEEAWPTQPFVTRPPAFSRRYFGPNDLAKLSPGSFQYLKNERMKDIVFAKMFTPPELNKEVICFPGYHGGGLWGGASWVADQGVMYISHNEIPWSLKLVEAPAGSPHRFEHTGYLRPGDQEGYPAISPPWAQLTAMDLNACKILWQVPLGEYKALTARGIKPTGTYCRGGNIATKGGLIFASGTLDHMIRAFDQKTGKTLWEHELGGNGIATPATYEAGGRQFVIVATSPVAEVTGKGPRAGFTAFALPK